MTTQLSGPSALSPNLSVLLHLTSWPARLWHTSTGESLGRVVTLDDKVLQINPEGHYMASTDVSDEIVYVAELDSGERLTLSQQEFEDRFGWKNDPAKAKIEVE